MGPAVNAAISSSTAEVTEVFTANIGEIMAVFGGLVALVLLVTWFKKLIGRKG